MNVSPISFRLLNTRMCIERVYIFFKKIMNPTFLKKYELNLRYDIFGAM